MTIRPKKVVLFPEIGRVKIFLSLTSPPSRVCIRIYIFCFKQKNIHRNKTKETKENRKTKETKEETEKVNVVYTTSVENLTWYDDIVWQFALCTFKLYDQPTKWERVLKNSKHWKAFIYICLLFIQDEKQDMLMQ